MKRYIIIASDSNLNLWAYGTPTNNRPFTSEDAAIRRKKQMERLSMGTGLSFVVLPLSDALTAESMRHKALREVA